MKKSLLIIVLLPFLVFAQNKINLSYYLPQNITYNNDIPKPESIIGHQVGTWHITHDKLVQYMYALAQSSDRITIENRGETFEDRPLLLLTITSQENHSQIEKIKKEHVKATNNASNVDVNNMPIVVYQGFSIHGNEPSGSNAALLVAYYLAAAESNDVKELLENTIILLDPSMNPDGLQRFAYWANSNKNKNLNPDPNDREYSEVWPKGRTNHYWFDLNRDWLAVQLPESKTRIEAFQEWLPNILTDHHEMGTNATFFFQPGVPERVHPLTPKKNQEITKSISNYHAKALDKIGSFYFTEESYDDFYYGKGSAYPDINGGIGILFEQASSRGHIQESSNGLLTFPFTIKNQFVTALSTLEAAKNMRVEILNYQHNYFENVRKKAAKQKNNAIVFGDEKDFSKTYHLAEILKRQNITFNELKKDFKIDGKHYKKGYSFIIPKNQKNISVIDAMFEKRTVFQDSIFYDVSTWTFPLAFNIDYSEGPYMDISEEEVTNLQLKEGTVSDITNYGYVMEWHDYYTPKALNAILNKGLRAKVALRPFSLNGKAYDYGTILIPVQNQVLEYNELYDYLKEVVQYSHVEIDAVFTGITQGIDLGSKYFKSLDKIKVALIVGDGVSSYDAGEIWHLFDQRYDITITKLDVKSVYRANLERYNSIIIPSMSSSALSEGATKKLKTWVQNGGTVIGYENTIKWFNSKEFAKLDFKAKAKVSANNITYEQEYDFKKAQTISGAIFEVDLDRSNPINFGYKNNKIALFKSTTLFLEADSSSYNNPIKYSKSPLLSGYISKPNLEVLKGTVPFKVKSLGKGKVVAFTDNTNFRAFWFGTNKLLMNAIFFRKQL